MKDRVFLDTNILVYLYSGDELAKRKTVIKAMGQYECCISTQVMNEFASVFLRKFHTPAMKVLDALNEIIERVTVQPVSENTIRKALQITDRLGFSYYDSAIIAAALESESGFLFSEDMQDGQTIEGRLTIRLKSDSSVAVYTSAMQNTQRRFRAWLRYIGVSVMPHKPASPCAHPGCPALSRERYCPEHEKLHARHYEQYQSLGASGWYSLLWIPQPLAVRILA